MAVMSSRKVVFDGQQLPKVADEGAMTRVLTPTADRLGNGDLCFRNSPV